MIANHEVNNVGFVKIKNKSKYFKKDKKYTIEALSFVADEAGEAGDLRNKFGF